MSELIGAIRSALSETEALPAQSNHFGVTFRPTSGILAGHLVTAYRSGRDPDVQELLARRHDAYVDCLRLAGIRVPDTAFRLLDEAGSQRAVIVQQAVDHDRMLVTMMRRASAEAAIDLLDQVAVEVVEFWRRVAQRPERIGFNARVERFAMDADGPVFLDTFPPLISYNRDEIGQLIQRFADSGLIRGLGKILPGRVRDFQDRWYTPAGSLSTLIDGALRVRPNDQGLILDWADNFASRRLEGPWRNAVQANLARQERRLRAGPRGWSALVGGRDHPHA